MPLLAANQFFSGVSTFKTPPYIFCKFDPKSGKTQHRVQIFFTPPVQYRGLKKIENFRV